MNNFHILYAVRSLMTGSYQDVVDVQLHRASIVEQNSMNVMMQLQMLM